MFQRFLALLLAYTSSVKLPVFQTQGSVKYNYIDVKF